MARVPGGCSSAEAGAGPALDSAEVAESAEVIRGNAHEAVKELQEVLRLLRAEGGGEPLFLLPRKEQADILAGRVRANVLVAAKGLGWPARRALPMY